MSAWQPIETAPKDGTEVLLAGRYKVSGAWEVTSGYFLGYAKRWPAVGENQPTHWMPLPKAPTPNDQEGKEG